MSLFVHYLSLPYLIEGIWFTLAVTGLGLLGGLILGLILTAMQLSRFWILAALARGYTVIFRGTPLILQMVFAYDALPQIGLKLSAIGAAGLALAANEAPFIAEMLRAGVLGVDRGQVLAGQALGMTPAIADAAHHRAAGDPHHDSRVRQRDRQRPEELVAGERDLGAGADAAKHAACVVHLRFLLDLLCFRADLSRAHHSGQRDSAVRGAGARSRPASRRPVASRV